MNSPILDILNKKDAVYTPIWLMRQAGRYLPEYRTTRAKAGSFLSLCKNPELATEVTLQPLRRFALDASIMFSDILVIPEAMGLDLYFAEGEGPKFIDPITSVQDIDRLDTLDAVLSLDYVMQTIKNLKESLPKDIPLIGFTGSPWTLACYMIEGGSSKNYEKIKFWLYRQPELLHKLLSKISQVVISYLQEQINSGVDILMIFDSWGGILEESAFGKFSYFYLEQIISQVKLNNPTIPILSFTKGGSNWVNKLDQLKCEGLGFDWTVDIAKIRPQTSKVIQGNLDPVILSVGDKHVIKAEVTRILENYKRANNNSFEGHIFNLGHGILPTANPDNVAYLVDLVHEISSNR